MSTPSSCRSSKVGFDAVEARSGRLAERSRRVPCHLQFSGHSLASFFSSDILFIFAEGSLQAPTGFLGDCMDQLLIITALRFILHHYGTTVFPDTPFSIKARPHCDAR